jgi:hypothetical protein
MKKLFVFAYCVVSLFATAQEPSDYIAAITTYQEELNAEFRNPDESPLEPKDLKTFTALEFFPIDEKYRVTAKVILTKERKPFNMPTTIPRENIHWKYADLVFTLDGVEYTLEVYQGKDLMKTPGYEDYLFLPFLDDTNSEGSYGGGRYIDVRIPTGDTLEIDFNKAYNPYCAYSARFSCPLVPRVNRLNTRIEAGVKDWGKH